MLGRGPRSAGSRHKAFFVHGLQRPRAQDVADFECTPDNTPRGEFILIDFS